MRPIPFEKWHGLGNDYLLIEREALSRPLEPTLVQRLCDYHFGVGSDGILEVLRTEGARAEILVWNPDGSTAELSGVEGDSYLLQAGKHAAVRVKRAASGRG